MQDVELSGPPTGLEPPPYWTTREAERRYFVPAWGDGYFSVNELGHVAVRPDGASEQTIDLYAVVQQLRQMDVQFPVLLRFQDLLHTRVVRLNEAFRQAIRETGYQNTYRGVFPIKVNQLREVVEEILEAGRRYGYGLECGSKSELIAALPYLESDDMLLLCNGCKDEVMLRLMLEAQRLGKTVLPILERYDEYAMLRRVGQQLEHAPTFGLRVRLSTFGAGLWSESGGENSKFGLSVPEVLSLVETLRKGDRLQAVRLLHFHLGSQIADVENVRQAVQEIGRVYARLQQRGLDVAYVDIGGGLGVSYEAGNPSAPGTINYSLESYAHTAVSALRDVCDAEGVPHPILVSESGRAITAYHSVLITEVIGTRAKQLTPPATGSPSPQPLLAALAQAQREAEQLPAQPPVERLEALHDRAEALRRESAAEFRGGALTLEEKALAEYHYWSACHALVLRLRHHAPSELPPGLSALDAQQVDHYLCDFSVFRSLIDHWALGQRFPILPIHRLDEIPTRRGILVDLTCDSDGKVAEFVSAHGEKRFLELHPYRPDEPYYLGIFLMGAYQDIMGDMHNLFGRVTEVHIYLDEDEPGNFYVEEILRGATVEEQLALVQYYPNDLERRMSKLIQEKVRAKHLRPKEGVKLLEQYRRAFKEYTYLQT